MPGSRPRRATAIATFLFLSACELPTENIAPSATRLLVHAVLDAGTPVHWIRVERSASGFGRRFQHVPGADVTITAPDGQVFRGLEEPNVFIAGTSGAYLIADLGTPSIPSTNIPLLPGGTYTLRIRTPDGEEVSGSTTMPDFVPLALPIVNDLFVRARDTLRLAWPRMQKTAGYEVDVKSTFSSSDEFSTATYTVFTDTTITIAGTARTFENEEIFKTGFTAAVHVAAVDDNYYTYYHPVVDPFAGAPPSRLTGAIGVFGSIAPVMLIFFREVR